MKPLIVAATRFEILDNIPLLEEREVPYLITGVGMTATAFALGKYLALNLDISHVLNVGIAGSFDRKISLGSVVSIGSDTFYELGAEDGETFISIDDLCFGKGTFTSQNNLILDLPIYDAITVNKVHGNESSISKVAERLPNVKIESMEGAAVFFACGEQNIHCAQIRAISNYVEKRNKSAWEIDLAINNLKNWLRNFILNNY
ncbi:futalosine hydrolase [Sphingobacterium litopenaei]|uniref:Futalosine hydrolase n=1 Tax=Sphingobacterium litopenaei TaxID=2763500 RepID=A0ABR7YC17_9SPHI|nr:futalosine hydrolase [Sphingobacterium litopenaei]MBD1428841.1 futalosine hydrolase [Sphingobacterium litopenaei]